MQKLNVSAEDLDREYRKLVRKRRAALKASASTSPRSRWLPPWPGFPSRFQLPSIAWCSPHPGDLKAPQLLLHIFKVFSSPCHFVFLSSYYHAILCSQLKYPELWAYTSQWEWDEAMTFASSYQGHFSVAVEVPKVPCEGSEYFYVYRSCISWEEFQGILSLVHTFPFILSLWSRTAISLCSLAENRCEICDMKCYRMYVPAFVSPVALLWRATFVILRILCHQEAFCF